MVTFVAGLIAGLIPLLPFALLPVSTAIWATLAVSISGLFALGSLTGRLSGDAWLSEGIRLVIIAGLAACAAALIGATLHVS